MEDEGRAQGTQGAQAHAQLHAQLLSAGDKGDGGIGDNANQLGHHGAAQVAACGHQGVHDHAAIRDPVGCHDQAARPEQAGAQTRQGTGRQTHQGDGAQRRCQISLSDANTS